MLTALNRPRELKLHVRGAINSGWSVEEIMEVLLQTAIYCGVPAALDSTRVAREALKELDISLDGSVISEMACLAAIG